MYGFYNRFIELASDINGNMPHNVVQRVADILNLRGRLFSVNYLLPWVAYKKM